MNKVTLFITSCGRPALLKQTLISFVKYNTYPIEEMILCEDSGILGIADFVKDIIPYPVKLCYNDVRIGQMKTIEKYTPLVKTPFVFHLEDDFEFFDYGFIELSFKIMETDKNISQVFLHSEQYKHFRVDIGNDLCYKIMTNDPNDKNYNNGDGALTCYSWTPSLKRIEIQKLRMPYELWDDEYTIQLLVNKLGYYSVIPKCTNNGFCRHIGYQDHVQENYQNIKLIARKDFPDKINIRMSDIM
jgi:hypothetical protein